MKEDARQEGNPRPSGLSTTAPGASKYLTAESMYTALEVKGYRPSVMGRVQDADEEESWSECAQEGRTPGSDGLEGFDEDLNELTIGNARSEGAADGTDCSKNSE